TVRDNNGNPIAHEYVSIGPNSGGQYTGNWGYQTDINGVLTGTVTSITAGPLILGAYVGPNPEDQNSLSDVNLNVIPGPPSTNTSSFTATPDTIVADGMAYTTLTITALDAHYNPLAGQTISLAGSSETDVFTPSTGVIGSNGVFTATLTSTVAERDFLTAT